ncbi:TIGR00269 family protein [Methanofollis formosanus]|uniref:TIGR00269 family protein n=1 Tax=Methanofollis formosanus TaxID=299308 RepID=A0A8G1A1E3_9EURY|nr:TIGR00269 family protein [Methanofollis formosanus]QYZ79624.1 TIGR00269 family protein [Methanofollis formosanus]
MRCSKCRKEAVIWQRYSGLHLCRDHFIADLEAKAKREIRKHRWVQSGDTIAVALSGGKDSGALLHFLARTFGERRDVTLLALTVDEGIAGYRDPNVAREIAESHGVPWHCVSFAEMLGTTTDRIVERKGDTRSCTYCGVLRRHCLNAAARDLGATRLAVGMNLDDEAQSVLMNVLRGDATRLLSSQSPMTGVVPRIKPFAMVPEREVALYAHLTLAHFEEGACPYSSTALRGDVRTLLNDYALRHPAARFALKNLGEELAGVCGTAGELLKICDVCGEPYAGEECRSCQVLREALEG